jgi:hypothetical protein
MVFAPTAGQKMQLMYGPGEFNNLLTNGVISQLYFRKSIGATTSVTFTNFQIKLGLTTETGFPGNGTTFFTNLATVLSSASYTINAPSGNTYFPINIADNFFYSNQSNLVVELSFTASTSASFAITAGPGPAAPSNKRLASTSTTATTGTASTFWWDFGFDINAAPVAPLNDLCSSAINLNLNNSCQPVIGTCAGATQGLSPISCQGGTSSAAKDVWYQFTALGAGDSIIVSGLGGFDPVIALYQGTCNLPTLIDCADDPLVNITEKLHTGTLSPGSTYFVRIYGWGGVDGAYQICARSNAISAPLNDICSAASPLTVFQNCNPVIGSNVGAGQSLAPSQCEGTTSSVANDVWYSFVAQTPKDTIIVTRIAGIDPVVELFSGTCAGLTSLACADNPSNSSAVEKVFTSALTPGQTYLVRVYGFGTNTGTFSICAKTPAPVGVSNDECINPQLVTMSTVCNPVTYSNVGATQSFPPSVCVAVGSAFDMWYAFTAVTPTDTIIVSPVGFFDPVVQVYSGFCNNLVSIGCSDSPSASATEKVAPGNLIPGTLYWVRVYGFSGITGSFSICGKTPLAAAPTNDNCVNAIPLSSSINCNPTVGTTIAASQSLPPILCNGSTSSSANDVWYSFVANGSGDSVIVSPIGNFDAVLELFGGTCTNPISIACSDGVSSNATEKISTGTLIPGATYRVRVYSWAGIDGNFNICVRRGQSSAVSNDNCAGAVALSSTTSCTLVTGSTTGATSSGLASCSGSPDDDVWYSASIINSGTYAIKVKATPGFNAAFQVYTGTCTSLTPVACVSRVIIGFDEDTVLTFTAGQNVFIRVYHSELGSGSGNFSICFQRILAPANNDCAEAVNLTPSTVCNPVSGSSFGASQSRAAIACNGFLSSQALDVWYRFTATSTAHRVIVASNSKFDPILEGFSGSCAALASIGCADDSAGGGDETMFLNNLTIGQTYFVRVYGWAGLTGDFTICVTGVSCNTVGGTTTVNVPAITANGRVVLNLNGHSPGAVVQWQASFDNGVTYSNAGTADAILPDTFFINAENTQDFFVRALVTLPTCAPGLSSPVSFRVNCATEFNQPSSIASGRYISNITFNTINNSSTPQARNGGYEDFTSISTNVCKGQAVQLTFDTRPLNPAGIIAGWIDFNNDGDFADVGEVIIQPQLINGSGSLNVLIPGTAATGSVKMRVMFYDQGTSLASSDPCAVGPYASGEIEEYTINIAPAPPGANAGNNATTCTPTFTLSGNSPGSATGTWTLVSGSGTFSNASQNSTQVNNLGLGANVFRWTIANACTSSSATVTITYTPAQAANAGTDQNICNTLTQLAGNAATGNASGLWTVFSGSGTFGNANQGNSSVFNLGAGLNQFIWTLTTPGCNPKSDTVRITRSVEPTAAFAGQDQSVCTASTNLAGNVITTGTGLWTLVSGSGQILDTASPTSQVIGLAPGISVFRWTSSNGSCPSSQDEVSITYTPTVQANAGQDQSLCADQATLAGNNPGDGTGTWILLSGSGTFSNPGIPNTSVTGLSVGLNRFIWTISNGNCPQTKDTVSITRTPSQNANAGQDQSICGGQANLSATAASSGSGLWTLVSGSGQISNPSDPNTLVSGLGTGTSVFRWTISNPPCAPVFDEVAINNLGNVTISNAGQDQSLCNTLATLAGNTATVGVGQWSLISGAGNISAPSSPNSTVTNLGVGLNVFRWTIINGNCPPSFDDVILNRVAPVSIANAGSDQNICTNTASLSANTPSVGTGIWSLVSGVGQISDPSNPQTSVSNLGTGANTFRWTIVNAPCAPSSDEVVITTTSNSVTASAGTDQLVCANSSLLAANSPGSGTGLWTVVSGSGTFSNPNQPNSEVSGMSVGSNVFRWTITNGACPPSQDEVNVGRADQTTVANAGNDQNICTSTATLSANNPQNGSGTWTLVSGTGTIADPSNPNSTVSGLGNGNNVFRWTISNLPCAPSVDEVTLATTLSAITANAGSDQTVCGTNGQLIGNSPGTGTGLWTLVSGSGNITNPGGSVSSITNLGAGQNVFRWTVSSGACPPSSDEVSITSVSNPVAANAGQDQNICGSSANLSASTPVQGSGTWTLVSGSGQIANPGTASTTVIGLGSGANVFRWTITNAPCNPSFDDVTINATPGNVSAQAGQDRTICGANTFMNGTAPVSGFGVWSLVSGAGTIAQPGNPVSEITNLGPGANTFAWTVTSGNCTASDLVVINREIKTLDLGKDTVVCIGSTLVLNAGSGYSTYQWFDNTIAQTVTIGSSGTYWVSVSSPNGCIFRDTIQVIFVVCTDVGPVLAKGEELKIFPNPSSGQLFWKMDGREAQNGFLRIYNSLGVLVFEEEANAKPKEIHEIRMHRPSPGLYLVEWHSGGKKQQEKVLVR